MTELDRETRELTTEQLEGVSGGRVACPGPRPFPFPFPIPFPFPQPGPRFPL
jgi:hypothetical protein